MACPNCKGSDYELVEVDGDGDEMYQKAECFECGVSGPMFPQTEEGTDQKAMDLFLGMINAEKAKSLMNALAVSDPWKHESGFYCIHCEHEYMGYENYDKSHRPDCIWLEAWKFSKREE